MSEVDNRPSSAGAQSEQTQDLVLRTLRRPGLMAKRLRGSFGSGTAVQLERDDGYLLCLQRRSLLRPTYWIDGHPVSLDPVCGGQFLLLDLNQEHSSVSYGDVDCVSAYLSRGALRRFHEEHDLPAFEALRTTDGTVLEDDVVRSLSEALLPALERPEAANRLFVDHVALALLSHLSASYGARPAAVRPVRGGLAPWQERRATEMLLANLDGNVGLDALAASCALSRSHFARSFKVTTGSSPIQWLRARRVALAQSLLANSDLPLDDIAARCGFADQSHFTRTFLRFTGATPSRWRRRRRL